MKQPRLLTYKERKNLTINHDEYYQRVLNPIYRETTQKYVVLDVCDHMSPLTKFPNHETETFEQHVGKFGAEVCNTNQPLLEVKEIIQEFNIFFPEISTGMKPRKHEKLHLSEHYIPEICHNYKFPADYWLKATLLPNVCHRIHYLLLAEELRHWLVMEGVDKAGEPQDYEIDVDYRNFDERENILRTKKEENEEFGRLSNLTKQIDELKRKNASRKSSNRLSSVRALMLWDQSKLPIDIDRNWLTLSEVDIDYYCNFINMNHCDKSLSSSTQFKGYFSNDRYLKDVERTDISMLENLGAQNSIQQKDLIKVLTTSNAGDVFDMERLKILGDAFLKFIFSLYLYKMCSDCTEERLTSLREKLVSDRNLYSHGCDIGLPGMIKVEAFKATESLPAGTDVPSNLKKILENDKTLLIKLLNVTDLNIDEVINGEVNAMELKNFCTVTENPNFCKPDEFDDNVAKDMLSYIKQQYFNDDVVADTVKALVGVVIQSLGVEAGTKLCQKLNLLPYDENIEMLLTKPIISLKQIEVPRDKHVPNRQKLEEIIGHNFLETQFLVKALTLASHPIKSTESYQQFKFLGEAVLDFLLTSYISEQCPTMHPEKLADLRSVLLDNMTLACIVVRNDIQKFLIALDASLSETIQKFWSYQASKNFRIDPNQLILLTEDDVINTAESADVPLVIGEIFESIIGAVYLDSSLNLATTWSVIYGLMKNEIYDFIANVPKQIVCQLFEWEKGNAEPKFFEAEKVDERIVAVGLEVKYRGERERKVFIGFGKNQSAAKKCAAKLALRALKEKSM